MQGRPFPIDHHQNSGWFQDAIGFRQCFGHIVFVNQIVSIAARDHIDRRTVKGRQIRQTGHRFGEVGRRKGIVIIVGVIVPSDWYSLNGVCAQIRTVDLCVLQ